MNDKEFCSNCEQKDRCKEAYKKLGKSKSPSVLPKVILAFLIPIVIFIVTLAAGDNLLVKFGFSGNLKTAVSFILAIAAVFLYLLLIKLFERR
jgi:hypothetical protein